jgi:Cu(I)/Ag(I) efflux system membrane fusion protein/cobalt-zinc-cadmium efflux system membrane fusion protein
MRIPRVIWAGALLSCTVLFAAACGSDAGDPQASGDGQTLAASAPDRFVVTFRTEPDPPAKGDNQVVVTVRRADGTPVTDGRVAAVFAMAAMPSMNMPAMRTEAPLTHAGDGRYRGTIRLSMGGTWEVMIAVRQGSSDLASRRTSVVASE